MVTIIPIDIDQDLIREGVQWAVASRLTAALRKAQDVVAELAAGGVIYREEWEAAWMELAEAKQGLMPVLEYAKAFHDQWPETDDA